MINIIREGFFLVNFALGNLDCVFGIKCLILSYIRMAIHF
jgi:hypothetical protein